MAQSAVPWQGLARVVGRDELAPGFFRLDAVAPEVAATAVPGQFVHLAVQGANMTLRRPISIHQVAGDLVSMVIGVVGRGTVWLNQCQVGATLDLIGPLGGRGLTFASDARRVALVGGGVGIPPLHFLATRRADDGPELVVFVGARSADRLLALDAFAGLGCTVVPATDDASHGYHGTAVAALAEYAERQPFDQVLACGPTPMLRAAAAWASAHGIPCQVCLEARMACGVGACLSCVIETVKDGWDRYQRVCTEGPVFDAEEVVWQTLSPLVSLPQTPGSPSG